MTKNLLLLPLLLLAAGGLSSCDSGSKVQRAQRELQTVKSEAAKDIQEAEKKLAQAIADEKKNIQQGQQALDLQRAETQQQATSSSSEQGQGSTSSATTLAPQDPRPNSEYCRGIEESGVSPEEQEAYDRSCRTKD